jgi:penicillin amidase
LYIEPEGWRAAKTRKEEIKVRKSTPVSLDVKITRHGPVICEQGPIALSVRWTALDETIIDLDAFLAINRARNWDDFVVALSRYGGPPQNFTYADTSGHIGYHSAGLIPIRKSGDGSLPYDGATDSGEWLGFIPFSELPHDFDPESGIIVQANQRIVDRKYPHHLTHNWRVPYRARRIHERLQAKRKFTVDDFLAIQGDTYSYPDAIFAAEVSKLAAPLKKLSGWDGYANAGSSLLPLVTEMRQAFRAQILNAALGAERAALYEWRNEGTLLDRLITERPPEWLPQGFDSYESLVLSCYHEAIDKLTKQLGPDASNWTWGKLAQVRFPHPLEKLGPLGAKFKTSSFPQNTGGSMPTVNAGTRVSLRFVADLSDWDETRLCLPLGESGAPSSAHREDQLEEWRNVAPKKLPFTDEAIVDSPRTLLSLTTSRR